MELNCNDILWWLLSFSIFSSKNFTSNRLLNVQFRVYKYVSSDSVCAYLIYM